MRTKLVGLMALLAASCTGKPAETPVRSVASPTPAPIPYRASPSAAAPAPVRPSGSVIAGVGGGSARTPAPMPAEAEQIRWHSSIAEAQREARASGRLILVGSTKPGCGLCDKFAHTIAPQCWARLSQVAVPYMFDITRYDTTVPENVRVDRTLRANLVGAPLMPLVGFLTPDLQWVHGFSGPRSVAEFTGDIESARRIYPVHAAALPQPAPVGTAVSVVNEFGEREWSAPADWPAPEDALGPVASLAAVTPSPTPEPAPAVDPAAVAAAPSVDATPALDADSAWSEPAPASIAASSRPIFRAETPAAAPAPEPAPVVAPATGGMTEAEAQALLQGALAAIRAGRLDEARATVKHVSQALPNTAVGREADRGGVAIYNARRIAAAPAADRAALVERARKDLGSSMWADLF